MVLYTAWLQDRVTAENKCEQWAFILSAYNGGLTWVNRDKKLAQNNGENPLVFFNSVENNNAGSSVANFSENRSYPRLILFKFAPDYARHGWGLAACEIKDA